MLTRQNKEEIVEKLTEAIKASPACVFAVFKGVCANDMVSLKRELRESGSTFQVVRKTLLSIALKNNDIDLDPRSLKGQIAVSISQDEITSAKILDKIGKDNKDLKLVGGVLEGELLDEVGVKQLAKMPSLDELRGMVVTILQSPAQNLVSALTSPQRSFAGAMQSLAEKKELEA